MANPEHLAILKQGVDVWNRWREENPAAYPNLHEADLRSWGLLSANFSIADLRGANLGSADLGNVNFSQSELEGVNLSLANLTGANFGYSDLCHADLTFANMAWTIFVRSEVLSADFSGAVAKHTVFADLDLSETIGLETVNHHGPSTIGIDTIYKSKGQIPEAFLRGCGVPDEMIDFSQSLRSKPTPYFSCFLSHSSLDKKFVTRLYEDLLAAGVRVWIYDEDAKIGNPMWDEITSGIDSSDKLVVICSKNSMQSMPVLREIERALDREDKDRKSVLFPIRIDDYVLEEWDHHRRVDITRSNVGDFIGWDTDDAKYDKQLKRLLDALQAED